MLFQILFVLIIAKFAAPVNQVQFIYIGSGLQYVPVFFGVVTKIAPSPDKKDSNFIAFSQ